MTLPTSDPSRTCAEADDGAPARSRRTTHDFIRNVLATEIPSDLRTGIAIGDDSVAFSDASITGTNPKSWSTSSERRCRDRNPDGRSEGAATQDPRLAWGLLPVHLTITQARGDYRVEVLARRQSMLQASLIPKLRMKTIQAHCDPRASPAGDVNGRNVAEFEGSMGRAWRSRYGLCAIIGWNYHSGARDS